MTLYNQLKEFHGALAEIATNTGYSHNHVKEVLKGRRQNDKIRSEAASVLITRKQLRNEADTKEAMAIELATA